MKKKKLLRGFKNLVSIDIGSELIKVVQLGQFLGKIRVEKVGFAKNPLLDFRCDDNEVNGSSLARIIRQLLRKNHIKARDAVSSIAGSPIIIQYFKFPSLSEKDLNNAVKLEAQRVMGNEIDGMETDFLVLPENGRDTRGQKVLFVAAPRKMVQKRKHILEQAGLNPLAVDIDCLALSNCFLNLQNLNPEEDVLLLNIGARLINLSILGKESLYFVRDIGLDAETESNLTKRRTLKRTVEEIYRSIKYYQSQVEGSKVARIFLTGGKILDSKVVSLLSEFLALPTEIWNPMERLLYPAERLSQQFQKSNGYLLAIAIGLGLRQK